MSSFIINNGLPPEMCGKEALLVGLERFWPDIAGARITHENAA
ncbi:MAG TPA: hypothetical protein VK633_08630 [Verrucomicrobiae bacterium]|nr:hypothetical protein [Verrucomicrobiae bacterium]